MALITNLLGSIVPRVGSGDLTRWYGRYGREDFRPGKQIQFISPARNTDDKRSRVPLGVVRNHGGISRTRV